MSLIKLAEDMVTNYDSYKYSDMVSLHWFVRCWDQDKNDFVSISSEGKNDYYDSFYKLVKEIKNDSDDLFKRSRMGVAIGLEKFQFYADVHKNYPIIREGFLEKINEPLKEDIKEILFDVPLIVESANRYIDYIYRAKKKKWTF